MPNTIDFAYVFANAGFADNVTIYMCVILTMLIYLMLLIWARREDLRDNEKVRQRTPRKRSKPWEHFTHVENLLEGLTAIKTSVI